MVHVVIVCALVVRLVMHLSDGRGRDAGFGGSDRYAGARPIVGDIRGDMHVPRVLAGRDRIAILCGSGRYAVKIDSVMGGVSIRMIGAVCGRVRCGRGAGVGSVVGAAR